MRFRPIPVLIVLALIAIFVGSLSRYRVFALFTRLADAGRCASTPSSAISDSLAPSTDVAIPARAFVSYPFNDRNIVHVDRGANQRVRRTMPVLDLSGHLVGQVIDVSKEHSAVRLVGSPDWEIPVRIGSDKAAGLLSGGPTVRALMIAPDATIRPGDGVFSASKDLPYGLLLGTVESVVVDSAGGVFQEAVVRLPYSLGDLTDLVISVWTPDF